MNIALMLLRTKDEYRKLTSIALCPSSSSSGSSSSSSSSSSSGSGSGSGRAGSPRYAYVSTMMHAFDALKALRGHCWEKLISYVRAAGHGYKTKDWIVCLWCNYIQINFCVLIMLVYGRWLNQIIQLIARIAV